MLSSETGLGVDDNDDDVLPTVRPSLSCGGVSCRDESERNRIEENGVSSIYKFP